MQRRSFGTIVTAVVGASYAVELPGNLLLGEAIALFVLLWGSVSSQRLRVFQGPALSLLLIAALIGYCFSDVYRGSHLWNMLRGSGRLVALFVSWQALAYLCGASQGRFRILIAAYGVAGLLVAVLKFPYLNFYAYKFGYSLPLSFLILSLFAAKPRISSMPLAIVLAIVHAVGDYRSLSATIIGASAASAVGLVFRRYGVVVLISVLALSSIAFVYRDVFSYSSELAARQNESDIARYAMASTAIDAIRESPVMGYGSWPQLPHLVMLEARTVRQMRGTVLPREAGADVFTAHSIFLQNWLEGGLLTVPFSIGCFVAFISIIPRSMRARPYLLSPLLAAIAIMCGYHMIFSPFGATQRALLAFGLAAHSIVTQLRRQNAREV